MLNYCKYLKISCTFITTRRLMELITLRLHIRELTIADLYAIHALHSIPTIAQYNTIGIPEHQYATEKILWQWIGYQKSITRTHYIMYVETLEANQFIGLIALQLLGLPKFRLADVWYKVHPAYWNKGFATEALKAMIAFGFNDLKLHRIEACCTVENKASISVLEKVGFEIEGIKKSSFPLQNKWLDVAMFSIIEKQ